MSSYNFKRLIKKYSKFPVTIHRYTDGFFNQEKGGVWEKGNETILTVEGAVVPLSAEEIDYDEGGTYTSEDKKVYTYQVLQHGEKAVHKDVEYTVHQGKDYTDFDDGLRIYYMRKVAT